MIYSTIPEYETAIQETQSAISRIILTGTERESDSGGGKRRTIEIELNDLKNHLRDLQAELAALTGTGGRGSLWTPGW